jgi:hypothetical protein
MKWRDLEGTIARMFEKGDITGFRKQDIILGPGETLILLEEGKINEIVTQTRLKDMGGGFKNWLLRKTGSGKDVVYLFVDTRPFDVDAPFEGNTKDFVKISGNITVKMQINTNDATKLLNFMREYIVPKYKQKGIFRKRQVFDGFETEGQSLTRDDILEKLMKEMKAKVFDPVIGRHDASEFHGESRVVADLQTEAMISLRKTLGMWGILLQDLYASFGETDFTRAKQYAAQREVDSIKADADFHATYVKDSERRGALYKTQITQAEEANDIRFTKTRERRWAEQMDHLEKERIEDGQDMATLEKMIALKEKMKEQKIKEFQEKDMKEKELDSQRDIELARIEAEKAKYNLETFKEAEERERAHQEKVIDKFSQFMGTGGPPGAGSGGGGSGGAAGDRICMHCGMKVQSGWKACPHCGKKL